mgnify:CR=1 FL=1
MNNTGTILEELAAIARKDKQIFMLSFSMKYSNY